VPIIDPSRPLRSRLARTAGGGGRAAVVAVLLAV